MINNDRIAIQRTLELILSRHGRVPLKKRGKPSSPVEESRLSKQPDCRRSGRRENGRWFGHITLTGRQRPAMVGAGGSFDLRLFPEAIRNSTEFAPAVVLESRPAYLENTEDSHHRGPHFLETADHGLPGIRPSRYRPPDPRVLPSTCRFWWLPPERK